MKKNTSLENTKDGPMNGLKQTTQHIISGASLMYGDLKTETYDRPKSWYLRLSVLDKIKFTSIFCFLVGTFSIYFAESDITSSNIKSFGDSAWWCVVTMATVGYGDKYPVTVAGRIIAIFVMLGGCTTFALAIAYIGSGFMDKEKALDNEINTIEELGVELKKIQRQLNELKRD